jgi:hypothetical protein
LFKEKIAGHPGEHEVAELVGQLKNEYLEASWKTRSMFPPAAHLPVTRVKTASLDRTKKSSPLVKEVRPEEVELNDANGEGELDASHLEPISYDHPLDNQDNSWVNEFLQGTDSSDGDENLTFSVDMDADFQWTQFETTEPTGWIGEDEAGSSTGLVAWGPDAREASSSGMIGMNGLITADENQQAQIDEAVKLFWETVNDEKSQHQRPPSMKREQSYYRDIKELRFLLEDMHISNNAGVQSPSSGTSTPQYMWTDDAADTPPSGISSSSSNNTDNKLSSNSSFDMPTTPAPTPTTFDNVQASPPESPLRRPRNRTKYSAMLASLSPLKVSNPSKYYKLCLEVLRQEVREAENKSAEPRELPNPCALPEDYCKGFWWWEEFGVWMPN